MNEIQQARAIKELGVGTIQEIGRRRILRLEESISSESSLEISLRKLENLSNIKSSIFIGGVGLTVGMENVKKFRFGEYNSIFIITEDEHAQSEFISVFPEGMYACIYFRGDRSASLGCYKILLDTIQQKGLQIVGDSIERTLIDEYISKNSKDHLTEIQIPFE